AVAICGTLSSQDDDLGTSTTALFQLGPNTWSPGPSLPSDAARRVWCSAIWLPTIQKVLIFGGLSSSTPFRAASFPKPSEYVHDCYLYDPSTNDITRTGDLPFRSRFSERFSRCLPVRRWPRAQSRGNGVS